jgi:hypothetical protein
LGTTFSLAAVKVDGKVVVVPDSRGRNMIPSVVSYHPEHGVFLAQLFIWLYFLRLLGVLVGYPARNQLAHLPKDTIFNAKRFIGLWYSDYFPVVFGVKWLFFSSHDESVLAAADRYHFRVIDGSELEDADARDQSVVYLHISVLEKV